MAAWKNTLPEDDQVEYIEDCFQDLERRKFGWRVKITLKEEEPCDLNIEDPSLSTCGLNSNPASKKSDSDDYWNHFAQNRQTGEGFKSAAPPDCRLVVTTNYVVLSFINCIPTFSPAVFLISKFSC